VAGDLLSLAQLTARTVRAGGRALHLFPAENPRKQKNLHFAVACAMMQGENRNDENTKPGKGCELCPV